MTTFDWFALGIGIGGIALIIYLFYLNDWDVEKTLFREEEV